MRSLWCQRIRTSKVRLPLARARGSLSLRWKNRTVLRGRHSPLAVSTRHSSAERAPTSLQPDREPLSAQADGRRAAWKSPNKGHGREDCARVGAPLLSCTRRSSSSAAPPCPLADLHNWASPGVIVLWAEGERARARAVAEASSGSSQSTNLN